MARSFIMGGVSATGLATGKPFIQRIIRVGGDAAGTYDRTNGDGVGPYSSGDNFTVSINGDGNLVCGSQNSPDWNSDNDGGTGGNQGLGGELLFVEFPSTTKTLTVELEESTTEDNALSEIRCKVMLTGQSGANGQVVRLLDASGTVTTQTDTMLPLTNQNFIEIAGSGSTATIAARTKGVFILIQKYAKTAALSYAEAGVAGDAVDAVSLLITAVLDHEGFEGGNGVQTNIAAGATNAGTTGNVKKIWPLGISGSDGIG